MSRGELLDGSPDPSPCGDPSPVERPCNFESSAWLRQFDPAGWSPSTGLRDLDAALKNSAVGRFRRYLLSERAKASVQLTSSPGSCTTQSSGIGALTRDLVPVHLPLMPASLTRAAGLALNGRRLSRWRSRRQAWRWTEWLVTYFSYYALDSPKELCDYRLGGYGHSGEQLSMIERLFNDILNIVRLLYEAISSATGPGRGPAKLVDITRAFELDGGRHNHKSWEKIASTTTAKAVDVSQIEETTPLTSGSAKPEHYLFGGRAEEFLDFRARVLDPQPPANTIRRGRYMLSTENEPALGKFLLDRGMASLIRESDVECDSSGRPLLAGLLGVPHRNGLRMIFDRRPENCGDARLHWAHLPLGAQFTRAVIKPGWTIRGSGEDLKTCFSQCLNAPAALSRSAFGRRFDGSGFEEFGGEPGSAYR